MGKLNVRNSGAGGGKTKPARGDSWWDPEEPFSLLPTTLQIYNKKLKQCTKYQTNWLSSLNTFVLKGNFVSLSQVENEYHLLEVEGYHENKTMLLNFKQILFPPKGAGLTTGPIFVPRKLWEGSELPPLIVGPPVREHCR